MRNIRKPSAILAAVFIAIILSSCATNQSFFDTRPYEENEEEKAIQYPFKVFGWYRIVLGLLVLLYFYVIK